MAEDTLAGGFNAAFSDAATDQQAGAVTQQPAATPEAQPEAQPRQPDGKFAPKADVAPVAAAPASPAPTPAEEPEKQPISRGEFKGYIEEREKRQKAEARAEAAERRAQQYESQQQSSQIPSASDPEAFAQYIQQTKTNTVFDVSETMAREKHGDEPVNAAMDWALQEAQRSPQFAAEYLKQKHPIEWAVKQQKRHQFLSEIGDDPEAYRARIIAEHAAAQAPATQAQPQAAPPQPAAPKPTPRPSLASAPTAGGIQTRPAVAPFDAAFPK
jgi:hypothetical protein